MIHALAIGLRLVTVTGPDSQVIELNPHEIISIRRPRGTDHFAPGTNCLIFTVDAKFISVKETCDEVHKRVIEGEK